MNTDKKANGENVQPNSQNLPLIDGKSLSEWQADLMGKTIGETSDVNTFSTSKLPKHSRVIAPGTMATMDIRHDRLSIHVDEDNIVRQVFQR